MAIASRSPPAPTAPTVTPMSSGLAEFAAAAAAKAGQQQTPAQARTQEQGQVATKERPGIKAKGIGEGGAPKLTYSGPAEDGSAEVKRSGGASAPAGGGTRKERREAVRRNKKR